MRRRRRPSWYGRQPGDGRRRGTRRGVGDAEAFEAELTAGGVGIEIEAAVEVEGPADDEADEDDHEE
jgi:hypothetical protein